MKKKDFLDSTSLKYSCIAVGGYIRASGFFRLSKSFYLDTSLLVNIAGGAGNIFIDYEDAATLALNKDKMSLFQINILPSVSLCYIF